MIRQLHTQDHERCMALLKDQPAENLFIIGDIEAYGYEQSFQKLWGDFDERGDLRAVLLKYEQNYIPYARTAYDAEGFAAVLRADREFCMLSGLRTVTEKLEPYLPSYQKKRQTYYAKCTRLLSDRQELSIVQKAGPEDAEALIRLMKEIPEFSGAQVTAEKKRRSLEDGVSRSFYIEEDGMMVSSASTAAENSLSAMIVAVGTKPSHKKRGYATMCMIRLCRELLEEGKELCLFYDNPEAGSIYKRIGFEDIGYWMMYTY